MSFLNTVPAIRRIDTDRADLLAFDVVGSVVPSDAENLFGLLEAAYVLHSKIDVLVRLVDFEGVEWAGLSDETLEGGKARALEHVGRCASVGGPDWTNSAQGLFTRIPLELRYFAAEHEAEAWIWLGARPLAGG